MLKYLSSFSSLSEVSLAFIHGSGTVLWTPKVAETPCLKGNSHQILLSEMSLPGVEVLIEKLLPKILGRLEKENPSERRCEVTFVQRKCAVTSSASVRFLCASYN